MTQRSPALVLVLALVTFGIYGIVWLVQAKGEMNNQGCEIPTAWLLIVPIANLFWLWKFSEGVGKVTNNQTSPGVAFLMLWMLGPIGMAIIQSSFNNLSAPAA